MTVGEYLHDTDETLRPSELRHGIVRDSAAPNFGHQRITLRLARLLADHVEARGLGVVAIAPVDVVLDESRALVVQPDVMFIAEARRSIVREQIWGAPDLVVEVLSPGSRGYDRGEKLNFYSQAGVRECWLVDDEAEAVVVVDFTESPRAERAARDADTIPSRVLPDLAATAASVFA